MKVLYVSGSFPPARSYGGPPQTAYDLSRHLIARGVSVRVLAYDADGPDDLPVVADHWVTHGTVPVYYASRLGTSHLAPGLVAGPQGSVDWADVVHVSCGPSLLFTTVALRALRRGLPVIFSPRGSLLPEALAQKSAKKRLYHALMGPTVYGRLSAWHATSEEEAASIAPFARGGRIAVVPNGVSVPAAVPARDAGPAYLAYLGRLHPHKRLELVIEAFGRARLPAGTELHLAGEGDVDHVEALRAGAARLGLGERVRFVGHVGGAAKDRFLAGAVAVVLASRSENFGMAVAESLGVATPAIATRTTPWRVLEDEGCGLWVDDDVGSLADAMSRLVALPEGERRAMGARGRSLMVERYSWAGVAAQMSALYESLRA